MGVDANTVVAYLAGAILILFSLLGFLVATTAGLIFLLAGLFALPVVRNALDNRLGVEVSRLAVVGVVIVGFVAGTAALGAGVMASYNASTMDESNTADAEGQMQEPQPTATATPSGVHEIGEEFAVGSGAKQIQYSVLEGKTASIIGGEYTNTDADGVFVIVTLQMENTGDETIDISSRHLTLVDSEGRSFETDSDAMAYAAADDRIQEETVIFEQLHPGLSTTGVLIYDVPEDGSYALKVNPVGVFSGAEAHFVALRKT